MNSPPHQLFSLMTVKSHVGLSKTRGKASYHFTNIGITCVFKGYLYKNMDIAELIFCLRNRVKGSSSLELHMVTVFSTYSNLPILLKFCYILLVSIVIKHLAGMDIVIHVKQFILILGYEYYFDIPKQDYYILKILCCPKSTLSFHRPSCFASLIGKRIFNRTFFKD